jgi:hypothetical protein
MGVNPGNAAPWLRAARRRRDGVVAGIGRADVAGVGMSEADSVPAAVNALGEVGLGGGHLLADPSARGPEREICELG